MLTDRQTHTDRQADRNTPLRYRGGVTKCKPFVIGCVTVITGLSLTKAQRGLEVSFLDKYFVTAQLLHNNTDECDLIVFVVPRYQAVCRPKFVKFLDNVEDPSYFPAPFPIVCVTFRSEDIRH